ncbi:MAG: hypothetical protein WCJ30_07595 [Deltaproteobacteria bacterium]
MARATLVLASLTVLSACPRETPAPAAPVAWSDAHAIRVTGPTLSVDAGTFPEIPRLGNPHLPSRFGFPQVADAGTTGSSRGFLGGDDAALLRRVCDANIERIERNRGGSTVSFRVWFEGGGRGLFKPQQRAEVANFRAELAAYRLSRLLGLHRVPPACGRRMDRARLQTLADASGDPVFSERVLRELIGRDDTVPGALLYWVPGPLENVPGTERWIALLDLSQPLAPSDADLAADLAQLVLFDFVTDNVDRWSGGNILRQHPAGHDAGPMLFMDNGASFSIGPDNLGARPRDQAERLAHVQRFPRAMIASLRALTADSVRAAMHDDPVGSPLGEGQIAAVLARRDAVVRHVEETARAHGEEAAMVFP